MRSRPSYADKEHGLAKQRMIQQVMERVLRRPFRPLWSTILSRLESVYQRSEASGGERLRYYDSLEREQSIPSRILDTDTSEDFSTRKEG